MKKHILIAILGLLCAFIDINYIGFLIALNLIVVLVCAAFPFMKKNYIFLLLLALNLALYFNAIDTPFEKPELWTYSIPALANATYVLVALVYASGFVAFVPLAAYICFLYSLCVVACGIREKFQSLR
ncbi:transporter [uncultured Campylobacter sp.]|uniref:transporter n=1 Tax=uncultured Campylobacter sp. TaxID=218934 RepID=UPI00262CD42E|nr:transporter [uncultured Campylobacter sp.]